MMVCMNAPASASNSPSSALGGKVVVVGIFAVALLAAAAGLAYKYVASQLPLQLWGATGVQLIQTAPRVELLTLSSDPPTTATDSKNELKFGDQTLRVAATQDISRAPGLIHHRHFLTEHVTYADKPASPNDPRAWKYAVRFSNDARGEVVVLFNLPNQRLGNLHTGQEVRVIDKIAENWQRFIERQAGEVK